jgi:SNF2 family DNA or RNA helicase
MKQDTADLGPDYREFDVEHIPLPLSQRVLMPTVLLRRKGGDCEAVLGSYIRAMNKPPVFAECVSPDHNWLIYENSIRPLPYDIGEVLRVFLGNVNPSSISFPDVLRLLREEHEEISFVADESIFEKATSSSKKQHLSGDIPGLEARLFPYQREGVAWMKVALDSWGGAILADEMGLGKTMQIISLLLLDPPANENPALIVCPASLMENWCREIMTFAPKITLILHRGPDRSGYYKDLLRSQVVVTTYETLVIDISMFKGVNWSFVICDEAQAVKNPSSKRRKAIGSLHRQRTIPVTGTPMENTLMDLWSLSDLAIPGVLGAEEDFEAVYPDTDEGANELSKVVDTFLLRRTVPDVAGDLPARTDVDIPIELDQYSRARYEGVRKEVLEKYGRAGRLVAVGQLALFCAHPWLQSSGSSQIEWDEQAVIVENERDNLVTPKLELCVQLLVEAIHNKRKVLVFSAFNNCAEIIRRALIQKKCSPHYWNTINGATAQEKRLGIVDEFTAFEGPGVLVLNPRAAGSGLNITAATVVIHYTLNWNPALEMQASARAHRRGQSSPVTIYRLFYSETVEETMIERSEWKRTLGEIAVPISSREKGDLDRVLEGFSS